MFRESFGEASFESLSLMLLSVLASLVSIIDNSFVYMCVTCYILDKLSSSMYLFCGYKFFFLLHIRNVGKQQLDILVSGYVVYWSLFSLYGCSYIVV